MSGSCVFLSFVLDVRAGGRMIVDKGENTRTAGRNSGKLVGISRTKSVLASPSRRRIQGPWRRSHSASGDRRCFAGRGAEGRAVPAKVVFVEESAETSVRGRGRSPRPSRRDFPPLLRGLSLFRLQSLRCNRVRQPIHQNLFCILQIT